MPNNYLSVLNKHIIQVENKNVGLKVGGGGVAQTYPSDIYICVCVCLCVCMYVCVCVSIYIDTHTYIHTLL